MIAKRDAHSYKCTKSVYTKAMRRAKREKSKLSKEIENFIIGYSLTVKASDNNNVQNER